MRQNTFLFLISFLILFFIISCTTNFPKDDLFKEYLHLKKYEDFANTFVNKNLQKDIHLIMKNHKVPYGVVIISDVRNGRIIAIDEYSQRGYDYGKYINKPLQAASIFKLITFYAALSSNIYNSNDSIKYYDRMYSELRNYLEKRNKTKFYNKTTIKNAMALSNNAAFAEISLKIKKDKIIESAEKFFFNNMNIRGIKTGYIDFPEDSLKLIKLASGLDNSYMSPLHALLITMIIGNDGKLVLPMINKNDTKRVMDIIDKKMAKEMLNSISLTTRLGTSRKTFSKDFNIAAKTYAKTGSIYATDPDGYYNWFVGIYDGGKSRYAIVVLTVNDPEWSVKANYIAFRSIELLNKYEED